jgi:hypothetical protein
VIPPARGAAADPKGSAVFFYGEARQDAEESFAERAAFCQARRGQEGRVLAGGRPFLFVCDEEQPIEGEKDLPVRALGIGLADLDGKVGEEVLPLGIVAQRVQVGT